MLLSTSANIKYSEKCIHYESKLRRDTRKGGMRLSAQELTCTPSRSETDISITYRITSIHSSGTGHVYIPLNLGSAAYFAALSATQTTQRPIKGWHWIGKDMEKGGHASSHIPSRHLRRRTDESDEETQDSRCFGWDPNRGPLNIRQKELAQCHILWVSHFRISIYPQRGLIWIRVWSTVGGKIFSKGKFPLEVRQSFKVYF